MAKSPKDEKAGGQTGEKARRLPRRLSFAPTAALSGVEGAKSREAVMEQGADSICRDRTFCGVNKKIPPEGGIISYFLSFARFGWRTKD